MDKEANVSSIAEHPNYTRASNEDDIALLFTVANTDKLRYDHTLGKWLVWDGVRWKLEETKLVVDLIREFCRFIGMKNNNQRLASLRMCRAAEQFCQADRRFAVTHKIWNTDLWLLCTPGGTVDLKTGELSENNPANLITFCTRVAPQDMPTPIWNQFLKEITKHDAELEVFLQRMAGYCLTGITREHALFFLYGFGGNGKGTFITALCNIMNDYTVNANMECFTASRHDRHLTELASLQDARMVTASETEEGRAWAESRVKQLTGGDQITARFMRQDEFTYLPKFKLVIQGNHAPRLHNVDDAMKRRLNVIPFIHKPAQVNEVLGDQLKPEYPGILYWAIQGCIEWQKNGLKQPASVKAETQHYFDEQNLFKRWIEECTEPCGVTEFESNKVLYGSWKKYALSMNEDPGSQIAFGRNLVQAGYLSGNKAGIGRGFKGIRVKAELNGYEPYLD